MNGLGLSWDALLKMTKIETEIVLDPDLYVFFEKVQEVEFLIFLKDITKAAINIRNLMIQNKIKTYYIFRQK